jgi:voltage-gated sodium channel
MGFQNRLREMVEKPIFQKTIIFLIIINAITLGLETYPEVMASYGAVLTGLDRMILWIFVAELLMRIAAYGLKFFKDPWNLFDFAIVSVSLVPAQEGFSVLRALRVLRVLRLISAFPRLRSVVQGLVGAIPGIASIALIMILIFYVFAVMATKLYGAVYPEWFGTLGNSFFTLFQIMTLEGWADMVRQILTTHPNAWIFFVIYILAATFTVLNLFIAVIVEAMQNEHKKHEEVMEDTERQILEEVRDLKKLIQSIQFSKEARNSSE